MGKAPAGHSHAQLQAPFAAAAACVALPEPEPEPPPATTVTAGAAAAAAAAATAVEVPLPPPAIMVTGPGAAAAAAAAAGEGWLDEADELWLPDPGAAPASTVTAAAVVPFVFEPAAEASLPAPATTVTGVAAAAAPLEAEPAAFAAPAFGVPFPSAWTVTALPGALVVVAARIPPAVKVAELIGAAMAEVALAAAATAPAGDSPPADTVTAAGGAAAAAAAGAADGLDDGDPFSAAGIIAFVLLSAPVGFPAAAGEFVHGIGVTLGRADLPEGNTVLTGNDDDAPSAFLGEFASAGVGVGSVRVLASADASFAGASFAGVSFAGVSFAGVSFAGVSFAGVSFAGISFAAALVSAAGEDLASVGTGLALVEEALASNVFDAAALVSAAGEGLASTGRGLALVEEALASNVFDAAALVAIGASFGLSLVFAGAFSADGVASAGACCGDAPVAASMGVIALLSPADIMGGTAPAGCAAA